MIRKLSYLTVCLGLLMVMGCAAGEKVQSPLVDAKGVKTLVDLHPAANGRLYSADFQQGGLIPICSDVTITKYTDKRVYFTVNSTGQQCVYLKHNTLNEPWEQHISKIFGMNCPDISGMSEVDQKGIKQGSILKGMTKQGVIYALGYPPTTRDYMQVDEWTYWFNHWRTFRVKFENGVVTDTPGY